MLLHVFPLVASLAAMLFGVSHGMTIVRFLEYDDEHGCEGAATEDAYVQDECHIHGHLPGPTCDEVPECANCMIETPGPYCTNIHMSNLPEPARAYRKIFCNATHVMFWQYRDSACTQMWSDEMYSQNNSRTFQRACATKHALGHEQWECDVKGDDYVRLDVMDSTCDKALETNVYRTQCHQIKCGVNESMDCSVMRACTSNGWIEHRYGSVGEPVIGCVGTSSPVSYNLNVVAQESPSKQWINGMGDIQSSKHKQGTCNNVVLAAGCKVGALSSQVNHAASANPVTLAMGLMAALTMRVMAR